MASNYTGNPSAAQAPSSAPGPGVVPVISIPAGTDTRSIESITQQMKVNADGLAYTWQFPLNGFFGDGSDGSVIFDGTSTVLGLVPSSSVYTLTRDIYCINITLSGASTVVKTNGYRIYAKGTVTTSGGAIISASGNNGSGSTAGTAGATGTVMAGASGGAGAASAVGNPGNNGTGYSYGGQGGTGGSGSTNPGGAGALGGSLTLNATLGSPRLYSASTLGAILGGGASSPYVNWYVGGGGGGSGGGNSGTSGGGGAGGGVLCIAARTLSLANASDLRAWGGNGGAGVSGNSGGGAGGGGGVAVIAYATLTAAAGSMSSATNCAGGSGGAGFGTGATGGAGNTGTLFLIQLA